MRLVAKRSLQTLAIVLALGATACFGAPGTYSEDPEPEVDLSLDWHDIEPPPGYVEDSYEGAVFPLGEDDPRATIELDPDTVLIDPGLFDPPPAPDELIPKWVRRPNERKEVLDTTVAPPNTTVLLLITLDGVSSGCSGTMVSPDAALTNSHCIFDPATQHWASNVIVVPGAYPDPANEKRYKAPYGKSAGKRLFSPTNWRLGTGETQKGHDYAIVRVNNGSFVSSYRTVGYVSQPKGNIEYYGYQGDLTMYQMYKTRGPIDTWFNEENGRMQVMLSLYQGASGSGVAASANASIVGVMSATSRDFNFAVFFSATKRDEIRRWIAQAL